MKVLFVDHTGEPGGAELCLLETVTSLGIGEVVLFEDGRFRVMLEQAGVPVRILPAPRSLLDVRREGGANLLPLATGVLGLAVRLARRARRYDVLYANSQKSMIVAALAGALARRPVVWHLHDLLTDEHFGQRQVRTAVGVARRLIRRVIANSEATRDAFVAAGGRPDHVRVVHNGIADEPFSQITADEVRRVRREFGVATVQLVGMFGRLAPWKGHRVLLDALTELPDVHALVVGDALFDGDRDFPAQLRAQAEARGVASRVHWAGFRDDVPALMHACDVIVHASTSAEPFGRVIVEGMVAGRPVIATDAGGARELVRDGVTGLLVPPGDASAMAAAIRRVLDDPSMAALMARTARDEARVRFAPAAAARQVHEVIRSALAEA